jgi:dihydrofolate reductase
MKLIVAHDMYGGIGFQNQLPWHFKEDLKRFRQLTLNQSIVMGHNTYKSIIDRNKKPLSNRAHIVLSKTKKGIEYHKEECASVLFTANIQFVLRARPESWIIGGSSIYNLFMPFVTDFYLTLIHKQYKCDTFIFPIHEMKDLLLEEKITKKEYSFLKYKRLEDAYRT